MKRANNQKISVNGICNSEQQVTEIINSKVHLKHYLKAIALVITLSIATIFSKDIQNTVISKYNKSVVFMQKHSADSILPLGV